MALRFTVDDEISASCKHLDDVLVFTYSFIEEIFAITLNEVMYEIGMVGIFW